MTKAQVYRGHSLTWPAISEICPPGEGTVVEIDKIFWETKQAS